MEKDLIFTPNMRIWFAELLDDAIADAYGAAENESVWADGSDNYLTADLHRLHAKENEEYAHFLEFLKDNILKYISTNHTEE